MISVHRVEDLEAEATKLSCGDVGCRAIAGCVLMEQLATSLSKISRSRVLIVSLMFCVKLIKQKLPMVFPV